MFKVTDKSLLYTGLASIILLHSSIGQATDSDIISVSNAENTSITIYSSPSSLYNYRGGNLPSNSFAIIQEQRNFDAPQGVSKVQINDIAAQIDATTVRISPIGNYKRKQFRVLEQSFIYDLVDRNRLINKFIDKPIAIQQKLGDSIIEHEGTLISNNGGLTLKKDDEVMLFNNYSAISFNELPDNFVTRPALLWHIDSKYSGGKSAKLTYQSKNIGWRADYNLLWKPSSKNPADGKIALTSWATIANMSGAGYKNASLQLMAGDVNIAKPRANYAYQERAAMAMPPIAQDKAGFSEKDFFEYHLYSLGRKVDLPDRSSKQIELFPVVSDIDAKKKYVFEAQNYNQNQKIDVYIEFENSENNGLGIALPAGKVRVSEYDAESDKEHLVGEDNIDHTPREKDVEVLMGQAFDLSGERIIVSRDNKAYRREREEEISITLKNHKKEQPVEIIIRERLYGDWSIKESSEEFNKTSANSLEFKVIVPADSEKIVSYTASYEL